MAMKVVELRKIASEMGWKVSLRVHKTELIR